MTFEEVWTFDSGVGDPVTFDVRGDWDHADRWIDIESMKVDSTEMLGFIKPEIVAACEKDLRMRLLGYYVEQRR